MGKACLSRSKIISCSRTNKSCHIQPVMMPFFMHTRCHSDFLVHPCHVLQLNLFTVACYKTSPLPSPPPLPAVAGSLVVCDTVEYFMVRLLSLLCISLYIYRWTQAFLLLYSEHRFSASTSPRYGNYIFCYYKELCLCLHVYGYFLL